MAKVLVILPEGFEEIETIAPIDLLRRAGADVVVAALAETIHVTGRCQVTLHADTMLSQVPTSSPFDLVVLPGGPGVKHLRADPRVQAWVKAQVAAKRPVAAICAAPTVLKDAGLLEGKRFTAHTSVQDELPARLAQERVVVDGLLVTSRGAGTSIDFGLALVAVLFGEAAAEAVRTAITA